MEKLKRKIENWKNMLPKVIRTTMDRATAYRYGQDEYTKEHWLRFTIYTFMDELDFARRLINKIVKEEIGA